MIRAPRVERRLIGGLLLLELNERFGYIGVFGLGQEPEGDALDFCETARGGLEPDRAGADDGPLVGERLARCVHCGDIGVSQGVAVVGEEICCNLAEHADQASRAVTDHGRGARVHMNLHTRSDLTVDRLGVSVERGRRRPGCRAA